MASIREFPVRASHRAERTLPHAATRPKVRPEGTILLVANYPSDVGYAWWLMENFWHVIATTAARAGGTVLLAYPAIRAIPAVIANAPLETIEYRFSWRTLRDIRRGLALIRRRRVTSIYLTDWPHLHWVYLLWRLAGVRRIVLHVHTSASERPPASGIIAPIKSALHGLRIFSATSYVAVSSYVADRLRVARRVPPRRCTVVTNGIPLFACDAAKRTEVRARLGIPADAALIVLVSRATFHKNLDFAVRCLARVLVDGRLRDKVYCVHCGDGPDLDAFVALARELDVSDRFWFLGRRADVKDILCAADIGFHPSHGEAMSLAILEFMCAGLAVVTSDLPSVSSAIDPGVTGVTYRYGDLDHAASVMTRLIEDRNRRRVLGAAACAAVRKKYSLQVMNRTFVERVIPALWQVVATVSWLGASVA